jgi:hypothetical protein
LEKALVLAGENRKELEKVLAHYGVDPADSLKYQAACFLIENMPIHYYYRKTPEYYDLLDSLNCSHLTTKEVYEQFYSIKSTIRVTAPAILHDIKTLSSEFLIQHIQRTFEHWEKTPWKDRFRFDDFCEYILPYTVLHEKREMWTDYYRNKYLPYIADYLQKPHSETNTVDACEQLNDSLILHHQLIIYYGELSSYPPINVDRIRSGYCEDYVVRTMYLARSLGIPVGYDFAPQWSSYSLSHSWNALLSEDGKHYPFMGFDAKINKNWIANSTFKCPKIYRYTFSRQANSLAAQNPEESPSCFLNQANLIDVTSEYIPVSDVTLRVKKPHGIPAKTVYLCVFNNQTWIPIHWGCMKNNHVTFTDMGREVVYLPFFYNRQTFIAAGEPFFLDSLGNRMSLIPHPEKKETLRIDRKYPGHRMLPYYDRMINGRFQGANKPDFSDWEDLHVIKQRPTGIFNTVEIENEKKFRYVRYTATVETYTNIAEMALFTNKDGAYSKLSGQIIGTEGSTDNMDYWKKEVVFDGDPLTFFSIPDSGAWVGLDLGTAERIDRIRYSPRNDDNGIRPGDLYELFYWDAGTWRSLGEKTGDEQMELMYEECPAGALFLLRNHTRGKEERIFTYENGKQIWW